MSPAGSKVTPENLAREKIDFLLEQSGWTLQDRGTMSLTVPAVAVREFKPEKGHAFADYLLFLDDTGGGRVCEAKNVGVLVRNVELQTCSLDTFWLKNERMDDSSQAAGARCSG